MDEIKGLLEKQSEKIDQLERKLDAMGGKTEKSVKNSDYLTASELCEKYGMAYSTLNKWIKRMKQNGYAVETRRASTKGVRFFNTKHFHRAYLAMTEQDRKEDAA